MSESVRTLYLSFMNFPLIGDATLVFEIELFEFHGEDVTKQSDGGVVKRIKVNGEGWDMPNDGAQVMKHSFRRYCLAYVLGVL